MKRVRDKIVAAVAAAAAEVAMAAVAAAVAVVMAAAAAAVVAVMAAAVAAADVAAAATSRYSSTISKSFNFVVAFDSVRDHFMHHSPCSGEWFFIGIPCEWA
jgi:hypothetical protein